MIQAKLCLLGEVSVGKTSLVRRFVDRSFSDAYLCTIGVAISRKRLQIPSGSVPSPAELELILWDIEGGSAFAGISPAYLRGARAAVVVGDCTRRDTIDALGEHLARYRAVNADGLVVVALNKTDLTQDHPFSSFPSLPFRDEVMLVLPTSARTGEGVDELFAAIGSRLMQDMGNEPVR
jgi:small GTP-binding protein